MGDTLEWRVSDKDGEIKGKREGNVIQLEGVRKEKVIRRSVEIGGAPWFQPLSHALDIEDELPVHEPGMKAAQN